MVNEGFNPNGAKVKIIYDDSSSIQIALDKSMTNFSSATVGQKELTVTYKDKAATINYRVDKIKLGRFYYYYEGSASDYEYSKEAKSENTYLDINGDGSAALVTSTSQTELIWEYSQYNGNEGLSIGMPPSGGVVFVQILSPKCLKMMTGANDSWIQIFRID